jgi:hypothetical protein
MQHRVTTLPEKARRALLILFVLLSGVTSGCVTHTKFQDETRKTVRFSSAEAARIFYEAHLSGSGRVVRHAVAVELPLIPYRHRTVVTENVRFNSAVRNADKNGDGIISLAEARAFADQTCAAKVE